jgi:hypothetical protein
MNNLQLESEPKVSVSKTLRKSRQVGDTAQSPKSDLSLDQHLAISRLDILIEDHLKLLDDPVTL